MEDLFVDYNGKYPSVGTVHWWVLQDARLGIASTKSFTGVYSFVRWPRPDVYIY